MSIPATAPLQENGNSTLAAIVTNQGTQATSALQTAGNALLSRIVNNQGTVSRMQLISEDGVTSVETALDSQGETHLGVTVVQSVYASTKNSSTTNIVSSGSYVGTNETTLGIAGIRVMLNTDQYCIVSVDQSGNNGTNWDVTDNYDYHSLGIGNAWTTQAVGDSFRVRVTNTGTATTTFFRLATALCPIVEALPRSTTVNGNLKISVEDMLGTFGRKVMSTPLGRLVAIAPVRLAGAAFSESTVLDTTFWGSTAVGTGTISSGGNQAILKTGTTGNSSVSMSSVRSGRFVPAYANFYLGVVRLPAVTGANIRRWGAYNSANGYFFEHNGTALSLVCRKNGVDTNRVSSGGFNGNLGPVYIVSETATFYEIHYTNQAAWFTVNGEILHKFEGLTSPLTSTSTLQLGSECINSGGNTANNTLEVRTASISRWGGLETESTSTYISTNTTTLCKVGAGKIHKLIFGNPDINATTTVYDGLSAGGTVLAVFTHVGGNNPAPQVMDMGVPFFAGLTIVTSAAVALTAVFE
jgi:hypothetical protein